MSSYDAAHQIATADSRPVRWLFTGDNPRNNWDAQMSTRWFGSVLWIWVDGRQLENFSGFIFCAQETIPAWLYNLANFFFERDKKEAHVFEYNPVWKNFRRITQEELNQRVK